MKEIAVGIDIGGTNTVFGIVDKTGKVLSEYKINTKGHKNIQTYVNSLCEQIHKQINLLDEKVSLQGIGVGAPNANYYKGTIENAANLEWKGILPFTDLMKEYFKVPTFITNDANAAALGEKIYGGAKNMNDFIFITLGTGLGSGLFANGNLIYGHSGFAGEMGHTTAIPNGRQCGCGKKGCLETYVSATGIVKTAIEFLKETDTNSILRKQNNISSKDIFDAAVKNDELALKIFDFTAEILGRVLADAIAYLGSEAIFLFGGLAKSGNILLDPLKKYFEDNLLFIYKNKIKILPSQLKNDYAAILGASALVFSNVKNAGMTESL